MFILFTEIKTFPQWGYLACKFLSYTQNTTFCIQQVWYVPVFLKKGRRLVTFPKAPQFLNLGLAPREDQICGLLIVGCASAGFLVVLAVNPCPLGWQRDCPGSTRTRCSRSCAGGVWSSLTSSANAANEGLKLRLGIWVCPEKPAAGNDV